jgi:2-methylaconitate cis-trans-isomerase PrpF
MAQNKLPAVFMRGGTSKAIVFHARDLPKSRAEWDAIFLAAIGSPDVNMRQLDGMGGGVSSLSKVCVVGPPTRSDADVDYTFAQVLIDRARVDYNGNCGNMSSAIGPFAIDEGLVATPRNGQAVVRIHNTNTQKIIVSRFGMDGKEAAAAGDMQLDGVAGTGAPIRLEFMQPGGAKTGRLLPTAGAAETLKVPGLGPVPVSMIDAANPCVFVPAGAIGASATERPTEIEGNSALLAGLEAIRRAASVAMGIAGDHETAGSLSVPFVGFVAPAVDMRVQSGRQLAAGDMDIAVRMLSNGQAHRAMPLTGALCLAVATRVPGSIPNQLARALPKGASQIRIAHASGITVVDAKVEQAEGDGQPHATYAAVYRTARRLFEGHVLYVSRR